MLFFIKSIIKNNNNNKYNNEFYIMGRSKQILPINICIGRKMYNIIFECSEGTDTSSSRHAHKWFALNNSTGR